MSGEVPDMLGANAEILRSILSQPLPDTLDMIIWRGVTNSAQASPFERFAARLLVEAGAAGIRDIAAENDFDVIRLSTTKRFWLRCNGNDLSNEQFNVVQAVESALNRIDYADDEARRGARRYAGSVHRRKLLYCEIATVSAKRVGCDRGNRRSAGR